MKNSATLTANGLMTGAGWPVRWRLPGGVTLSVLLHVALIVGLLREERIPPLLMAGNAGGAVAFSVLSASHGSQSAAAPAAASPVTADASRLPASSQAASDSARPLATEVTLPDPEIALPRAREPGRDATLKAAADAQQNKSRSQAQNQASEAPRRDTARSDNNAVKVTETRQLPAASRKAEAQAVARQPATPVTPASARQQAAQPVNRQAERTAVPPVPHSLAAANPASRTAAATTTTAADRPTSAQAGTAQPGGQAVAASGSTQQAGSSALKNGASDSGSAAQGAGSSNNQNFRALHRRVDYPQRAKALGVEGRVRIKFDVTASGTVTNVRILSETPPGVFAQSVTRDIARWRYQTQAAVNDQVASIVFKLNGQVALEN